MHPVLTLTMVELHRRERRGESARARRGRWLHRPPGNLLTESARARRGR